MGSPWPGSLCPWQETISEKGWDVTPTQEGMRKVNVPGCCHLKLARPGFGVAVPALEGSKSASSLFTPASV